MTSSLEPPRILVIDDEEDVREMIDACLVDFDVVGVPDLTSAWNTLRDTEIDLVLLDLMLPKQDGFDFLRRWPSSQRPAPPVIIVSALSDAGAKAKGLTLGADDFVTKPFCPDELSERIGHALRRRDQLGDRIACSLLAGEEHLAERWAARFGTARQAPGPLRDLLHEIVIALHRPDQPREAIQDPAYALGVLRAQQGHSSGSLAEDLFVLRPLLWGFVMNLPFVDETAPALLPLLEGLTSALDLALTSGFEAFVEESTRMLALRATRDVITGLANRGVFEEVLGNEIRSSQREPPPALILLDLDGFKRVNDTKGHLKGDEVLVHIARVLEESVRSTDLAARIGGDEFAIVLPRTQQGDAFEVAQRVIAAVRSDPLLSLLDIGASIGVGWLSAPESSTELIGVADRALYRAKREGGARAEQSTELDSLGLGTVGAGTGGD
jgi:diguanylate cyclase (GGDEF)-like protein